MADYNYLEAMKEDITSYIADHKEELSEYTDKEEMYEYLNEELFLNDSVTGNASGSYTFNTYKAEEYICHNMDLYAEACEEYGTDARTIIKEMQSAETIDVIIRCYLLSQAISEVLDDMEEDGYFDQEEDED